jgi:mitochondrial fission protein ELM1
MLVKNKLNKINSVWVLADDRIGSRSQSISVADALGADYHIKEITYGIWAFMPNRLLGASFSGLTIECQKSLSPPWPDMVISSGRRTAPVAKKIRSLAIKNGIKCFLVHIMDPGGCRDDFGIVAVPRHDGNIKGSNIFAITGAPHQITKIYLESAAELWHMRFEHLNKPRIALIVGGSTRHRDFTSEMAKELASWASSMALKAGGSLLITTSRRTGSAAEKLLESITAPSDIFCWDEENKSDNPYKAYLALADAIIVTGDSSSMCSEACGGIKPVYIYAPTSLTAPKHRRLHQELFNMGYARPLTAESLYEQWSHPPLNAADDIAQAVFRCFQKTSDA